MEVPAGAAVCSAVLPAATPASEAGPVACAPASPASVSTSPAASAAPHSRHRVTLSKTQRMSYLLAGERCLPALRIFVGGGVPRTARREESGGRRLRRPHLRRPSGDALAVLRDVEALALLFLGHPEADHH